MRINLRTCASPGAPGRAPGRAWWLHAQMSVQSERSAVAVTSPSAATGSSTSTCTSTTLGRNARCSSRTRPARYSGLSRWYLRRGARAALLFVTGPARRAPGAACSKHHCGGGTQSRVAPGSRRTGPPPEGGAPARRPVASPSPGRGTESAAFAPQAEEERAGEAHLVVGHDVGPLPAHVLHVLEQRVALLALAHQDRAGVGLRRPAPGRESARGGAPASCRAGRGCFGAGRRIRWQTPKC